MVAQCRIIKEDAIQGIGYNRETAKRFGKISQENDFVDGSEIQLFIVYCGQKILDCMLDIWATMESIPNLPNDLSQKNIRFVLGIK